MRNEAAGTQMSTPLLQDQRFVLYLLAKLLGQTAQNALLYGLFIIVIREQDSAIATSAFVIATTAPSILLSIPGAVIAESIPRKAALLFALLVRAGIAWTFIGADASIALAIGLALAVSTAQQVFGPAESSALRALVPDEKIGQGAAITNATSLLSQVLGAGLLAPLTIKAGSDDALFTLVFSLLLACSIVYLAVPGLTPKEAARNERSGLLSSLPEGWRIIRSKSSTTQITILAVTIDAALTAIVVVVPLFVIDVLKTSPENAVYVFAPAAVGMAIGLVVAPALLAVLPGRPVVMLGFVLVVGVMFALPFVHEIARELDQRTFLPLSWLQDWLNIRREIATTALVLPLAGLGVSLVEVGSRTALYHASPAERVGQVLSTKSTVAAMASIVPTLAAGIMLDLISVEAVMLSMATATAAFAGFSWFRSAQAPSTANGVSSATR